LLTGAKRQIETPPAGGDLNLHSCCYVSLLGIMALMSQLTHRLASLSPQIHGIAVADLLMII
jgi:hypothetical protein